jgi:hypothetical protein
MADKRGLYFGMTRAEFAALPASEQLRYVERHFAPYVGQLVNDAAVYLAVFLPAQIHLAGDPDAVVAAKDGPYGFAWRSNVYFDFNGDAAIQVRELEQSIALQCQGPRWTEIAIRAGLPETDDARGSVFDLRTTLGIQHALATIGFSPGPCDGLYGAKTTAAIRVFQAANGLTVDGDFGPKTRACLQRVLRERGIA